MIVGFTGTRDGLTLLQKARLSNLFAEGKIIEFHHGDCVGADAEAHKLVRKYAPQCKVVIHPPSDEKLRMFCPGDITLDPLPYLDRNRAIVDACAGLVACPRSREEELRSGTWSTVRYAREKNKLVRMIWPD